MSIEMRRKSTYDAPVIFHNVALAQFSEEILVMCDDDQLEAGVILALVDNACAQC